MVRIEIHEQACRGCRLCVEICPTEVFTFDEPSCKARVRECGDCIACLSCAYLCPAGAIQHFDHHVVPNYYRDQEFCSRLERYL